MVGRPSSHPLRRRTTDETRLIDRMESNDGYEEESMYEKGSESSRNRRQPNNGIWRQTQNSVDEIREADQKEDDNDSKRKAEYAIKWSRI